MSLLSEIAKSVWMISPQGYQFWAPFADRLLNREKIELPAREQIDMLSVFDKNLKPVQRDANGNYNNVPKGSVAMVSISDVLVKNSDWCITGSVDIVKQLQAIEGNSNIVGTVAYFDGPGGSVSAISPFLDFMQKKTKPIVGLYDMCCSAHLYSMLAVSDHIMAENDLSSNIGSVGVMISLIDNREQLKQNGKERHDIYSNFSSEKNLAFRMAMDGDYEAIKTEMLDPIAVKFQDFVKMKRPNLVTKTPGLLTGKTFGAGDALDAKLIDSVGNLERAMLMVQALAEIKK